MGLRRVLLLLLLHRNDDRWRLAFISAALVRTLSSDACARPRPKPSAYKVVRLPAGSIAADAPVESIHPAFCVGAWASLSTPEARPAPAEAATSAAVPRIGPPPLWLYISPATFYELTWDDGSESGGLGGSSGASCLSQPLHTLTQHQPLLLQHSHNSPRLISPSTLILSPLPP